MSKLNDKKPEDSCGLLPSTLYFAKIVSDVIRREGNEKPPLLKFVEVLLSFFSWGWKQVGTSNKLYGLNKKPIRVTEEFRFQQDFFPQIDLYNSPKFFAQSCA